MLTITNFQKSYRNQTVLKIDDFSVEPGIFWIKGINGSGKSTLLKAVAGTIPFDGEIILHSEISLKKQSVPYRKLVNFAEAEPIYPDFLTGREMIGLFSSAKSAPKQQEDYFIESMEMGSYIADALGTYSSGMMKKLSLLLAFLGNPALILLDEPLITIDTGSLKILYKWITESHKNDGTSFLLSSHQALENEQLPPVKEILVAQQTLQYN